MAAVPRLLFAAVASITAFGLMTGTPPPTASTANHSEAREELPALPASRVPLFFDQRRPAFKVASVELTVWYVRPAAQPLPIDERGLLDASVRRERQRRRHDLAA